MSNRKHKTTYSKNRKLVRKLNEDARLMQNIDAFTEESMHDSNFKNSYSYKEIEDNYRNTIVRDDDW